MLVKKARVPVPEQLAAIVQYKSHRTCCKCRTPGREVQLHHIDEDPSNNVEENLAVLCLLCHNETLITGGFGRKLDAAQVRLYKAEWEAMVERDRTQKPGPSAAVVASDIGFHVRASWVDSFVTGTAASAMRREVRVTITNRSKETRFIESFGFRIDTPEAGSRHVELQPVLSLAQFKKQMASGEQQSFSVALADLLAGPAHEGLRDGEALSAFVYDTFGETCYSAWLRFEGE